METVGQRIKFVADKIGGVEALAIATGVKRTTMFNYVSGNTEPKVSVVIEIAKATGVSVEWLMIGRGDMLRHQEISVREASLDHVRKVVYNIAYSMADKGPRRIKPKAYAENFLELFDYLMKLEDYDEKAAEKVIEFGAERLKRTSGSNVS